MALMVSEKEAEEKIAIVSRSPAKRIKAATMNDVQAKEFVRIFKDDQYDVTM
eukprot:CAMPEP_0184486320 /NCGR_PEP_ID=MMETSP0113_2-20130426/7830_1 /TAXON_ID=91329 /ORGANISM="Norrisiella sphaerica, Strain BC52" /LENGTH=51 /DNA_ID=CAMNT_0026868137 /DNA_START=439 /DNA_END=591 /DNA_ORIENTATION=+